MPEYKTTVGFLHWDEKAYEVVACDDPVPPEGEGWTLVTQSVGDLRMAAKARRKPVW